MQKGYKIIILMFSALLLFSFSACQKAPDERTLSVFELVPMDTQKQAMVRSYQAWQKENGTFRSDYTWDTYADAPGTYTLTGYRYYGTFNDCMVWFAGFSDDTPIAFVLAFSYFYHPNCGDFRVCKNGEYISLTEAVYQKFLSVEDIAIIAARHAAYNDRLGVKIVPYEKVQHDTFIYPGKNAQ